MASRKTRTTRGFALAITVAVLTVAACAAAFKAVILPALRTQMPSAESSAVSSQSSPAAVSSAPASSAASSAVVSSPVSSAPAPSKPASQPASSALKPGSYAYFTDAVFIGDSLTSGIQEYSVTKTAGVFASNGLSASTAQTKKLTVGSASATLTIPDAVRDVKPAKIYVMLGSNDISYSTQSTFLSNYGALLDKLRASAPNAIIYVQSILPVTAAYESSTGITNDKINTWNAALSSLSAAKKAKYVDVGQALKGSDGKLPAALASDGYNIKKSAYKTWLDTLTMYE